MKLLERLGRHSLAPAPAAVAGALEAAFEFLVVEDAFEVVARTELEDGASVAFASVRTGTALVVAARAGSGLRGWLGSLDADGRLRPLTRETVGLGYWRDLAALGIAYPRTGDLFLGALELGRAVRRARSGTETRAG